ncbi:CD99 antigen-like protein 2 [Varanus komodoensis]|nr:CD99 antigen-like protein 2 [Varanus komodoensis]
MLNLQNVHVKFAKRSIRDNVLRAVHDKPLKADDHHEVTVLKQIPWRIREGPKKYLFLTTKLAKEEIMWLTPEGIFFTWNSTRYKLDSVSKAQEFYEKFRSTFEEEESGASKEGGKGAEPMELTAYHSEEGEIVDTDLQQEEQTLEPKEKKKGQDFDLSDALPSHGGFDLGDAIDDQDSNPAPPPPPPQPKPGSHGNSGELSDLDLVGGKLPPEEPPAGRASNPSPGSQGMLAGIISSVVVAVVGAASSFIAYQKKKLCFKASDCNNETATHVFSEVNPNVFYGV